MSVPKQEISMLQLKKQFEDVVVKVEKDHKANTFAYKAKYYQLVHSLNLLNKKVKSCLEELFGIKREQTEKTQIQEDLYDDCYEVQPFAFIQYFQQFCKQAVSICSKYKEKQQKIREQFLNKFTVENNLNFLETLARKCLQNYDLNIKKQELEASLELKKQECILMQKTTEEYQKKFRIFENDYNQVIISIANILKQSQISEISLKQENRLQKELIQTHKIEFERYKMDFKLKPTFEQKLIRIKENLEKKFKERQVLVIKQTEKVTQKLMQNKIINQISKKRCNYCNHLLQIQEL